MRRRIPNRVCSCKPNGAITHVEVRLLKNLVNQEIHAIRCAESCKRKYQKGMRIGNLCEETGHSSWALKVRQLTEYLIENKTLDDKKNVQSNKIIVRLEDVISEGEYESLSQLRNILKQVV